MARRRELLSIGVLFLIFVLFTIFGPGQSTSENGGSTPTTHSSGGGGVLALLLWLQALGYDASRLEFRDFVVDETVDALIMLNPSEAVTRDEARMVLDWVDEGGLLIIAHSRPGRFGINNTILDELQIHPRAYEGSGGVIREATTLQPVFSSPPLQRIDANTATVLETERVESVPLLGVADGTVVMGLHYGDGYIYLSSAVYPFTNDGLRKAQHAAFILNLLRHLPPGATVWFDEYHHGFFEPPSLRTIIMGTPWGWALLYIVFVIVFSLILTGRRFGAPVPLPEEIQRRSSAEYVESMADLFRRSKKQQFLLDHYATMLKRRLARPWGMPATLDDSTFVHELARHRDMSKEEHAHLVSLFARMRQQSVSDEEILALIREADACKLR